MIVPHVEDMAEHRSGRLTDRPEWGSGFQWDCRNYNDVVLCGDGAVWTHQDGQIRAHSDDWIYWRGAPYDRR